MWQMVTAHHLTGPFPVLLKVCSEISSQPVPISPKGSSTPSSFTLRYVQGAYFVKKMGKPLDMRSALHSAIPKWPVSTSVFLLPKEQKVLSSPRPPTHLCSALSSQPFPISPQAKTPSAIFAFISPQPLRAQCSQNVCSSHKVLCLCVINHCQYCIKAGSK